MADSGDFRLTGVTLSERAPQYLSQEIAQEREIALHDLLESNFFKPLLSPGGPYQLNLGIEENRLIFNIHLAGGEHHGTCILSLTPLRRVIKDYFAICDSYGKAIPDQPSSRVETIDMARRGIHDEAAFILQDRLGSKICVDIDTARRLFTLICVLHLRG